jgi:hypothetical protein
MGRCVRAVVMYCLLAVMMCTAGATVACAQSYNYSHRYTTTMQSANNRAAVRAALRKARVRKARQKATKPQIRKWNGTRPVKRR